MSHTSTPCPAAAPTAAPATTPGPAAAPPSPRLRRWRRLLGPWHGDDGMSTVEYAIGTVAAAAFAAVLYSVVSGESVVTALTSLVERALSTTF